jgi:cystathionine beta-lyase/cystathionine gamma-synthase
MPSHRKMPRKSETIEQRPVVTPIYQSTTFAFPNTASLIDYQRGRKKGYLYTRYGNPTLTSAEERLSELDGSEQSLFLASGMAAIATACLSVVKAGDEIVSSFPLYGGTAHLFNDLFKNLGISVHYFPAINPTKLSMLISPKTKLIYLESPTNPNLEIIDLEILAAIAKQHKIFSMIDSTFATPINQKPLDFGIDAVIHSATKYLGGHSDIMGGVISGKKNFVSRAVETMKLLGGCADPHQAFLLERGLKTLGVRMSKHNENAMKIAHFIEMDLRLKRVIYPGLESHPQHAVAQSQMNGYGGMVSFDLGSEAKAIKFADALKVVKNAVSLGGVESLLSIPVWTSHIGLNKSDLTKSGVTRGLVRLSVGLEESNILIEDIKNALNSAFRD